MPQWLVNSLIKNVVYPLLLRGVTYIAQNYLMNQNKKQKEKAKKERKELLAKVKAAKTNDEIIKLSRDLHNLNVGKM